MTRSIKDKTLLLGLDLWKTDICFDYLSSFGFKNIERRGVAGYREKLYPPVISGSDERIS